MGEFIYKLTNGVRLKKMLEFDLFGLIRLTYKF